MPGVLAAGRPSSTSSQSGTLRVWTSRMRSRPARSGGVHGHPAVETVRAKERVVEDLGAVRGRQHDYSFRAREAVHLGEDLVEGLLAFVAARTGEARHPAPTAATDRVKLVDEDDRRGVLLRLLEQVPYPARADPGHHLDELRGRHRVERNVGLAGDRPCQQCLARPGRPGEENALGDRGAQGLIALGPAQEVDDLDEAFLGLVNARDVIERRAVVRGVVALRARLADREQAAARAAQEHEEHGHEQQRRPEAEQQQLPERALVRWTGPDLGAVSPERRYELVVREGGPPRLEARASLTAVALDRSSEAALNDVVRRRRLGDIAGLHFVEELRI